MTTQLEVQELTFKSISREIHDSINLSLTATKIYLNTLTILSRKDAKKLISASIDLISTTIVDITNLSRSLSADLIGTLGLITAIEKEIEKVNLTGLFTTETEIIGEQVSMDVEKELLIFRIVQESLNNIIRHSKAKFVKFTLQYSDKQLDLIIKDDGIGFKCTSHDNRLKGSGLKNINTRAKLLNGKATISSEPGQGTCIHISIPYHS